MAERADRRGLARYGFLADPEGRARRGRRIVRMLRDFVAGDLSGKRVLDIGCSAGLITCEIARHVQFTIGLDVDAEAVAYASTRHGVANRLAFACASGDALPFCGETFDIVVCNHVYEHVRDAQVLMAEIARVLKPDGACWFAAGHTWQLIEPHYRLPLLSLLPRGLASALVRTTGRGECYEIRFLAPWRVPALFAGFGEARLVSIDALRDPIRYELCEGPLGNALVRSIVRPAARSLAWIAPTQLWILRNADRECVSR